MVSAVFGKSAHNLTETEGLDKHLRIGRAKVTIIKPPGDRLDDKIIATGTQESEKLSRHNIINRSQLNM